MAQKKRKEQFKESQSSTAVDELVNVNTDTGTPLGKEPSLGECAYDLAKKNEKELLKLRRDIHNPDWIKNVLDCHLFLSNSIKWILLIFLILLTSIILAFFLFVIYQLINLNSVFEDIRNFKILEVNENILEQFNKLFYQTRKIINLISIIIGSITVVSIIGLFLNQLIKKVADNLTIKSKDDKN